MTECDDLHARADMLHNEAELGLQKAERMGSGWEGSSDQVAIALRCKAMAEEVEFKIAEDCP